MSISSAGSANALSGYALLGMPRRDTPSSVETEFLDYAKMSPIERLRANIPQSMGLTEEALSGMPTEERQAIEDQIKEKIKELLKGTQDMKQGGGASQSAAAATSPLLSSDMLGQLLSVQSGQDPGSAVPPTSNTPVANSLNGPLQDAGLGPAFFMLVDYAAKIGPAGQAGRDASQATAGKDGRGSPADEAQPWRA